MQIVIKKIQSIIDGGGTVKLNLGAGNTRIPDFLSVDLVDLPGVDIVADLNKPLDLIPDSSVSAIFSQHSFEHLENFMGLMNELHRICAADAEIIIIVPHFSYPFYYSDPTHKQHFGLYTMHYFMDEIDQPVRKVPSFYTKARFDLVGIKIEFIREKIIDKLIEPIVSRIVNMGYKTQDIYERRFCYVYPAWQIRYTLLNKNEGP